MELVSAFVDLTRRVRSGDSEAESEVIRRLQPGLRMLLGRRLGGDWALVDDLVQETLLVVLKRLRGPGLEDPGGLARFAAGTARNLAIGVRRKQVRQRTDVDDDAIGEMVAPQPAPESQAADDAAVWAIRRVLDEMRNDRDRQLLRRFYLEDDDKETLCREFEMTEAHLNLALFRARSRFRAILQERGLDKSDLLEVSQ